MERTLMMAEFSCMGLYREVSKASETEQVKKLEGNTDTEVFLKRNEGDTETEPTHEIFKKPILPVLSQAPGGLNRETSQQNAVHGQYDEDSKHSVNFVERENHAERDDNIGLSEGCADGSPVSCAPDVDSEHKAVLDGCVEAENKRLSSGVITKPNSSEAVSCPPLPYKEPLWGGIADSCYSLEVLKNGSIISTVPLTKKSFYVFGRLPNCDVSLEHPSISRYHAVLQFRLASSEKDQKGFYLYDLGSTHGTVVNKAKIHPEEYFRLKVGHVIKFGGSSRLFILRGPEDDQEKESELTVTELKQLRQKHQKELEKRMLGEDSDEEDDYLEARKREQKSTTNKTGDTGCSWGMVEDAEEEEEGEENPFAVDYHQEREALYIKDPKKALQGFFEREGEELEYEYEDRSHGTWLCRIRLPVDDASGRQLVAEATHSGKKKDAQIECALEACRILDARGLLRQEAVSRKRKAKNWEEEDFYDSDDDAFLDRTGSVEKKRLNRMKKAGKIDEKPETYESLLTKLNAVEKELTEIEEKLASTKKGSSQSVEDPLDAFMTEIKSGGALDNIARKKLHLQSFELKKEEQRLKKLIKIVKPTSLPDLKLQNRLSPVDAETKPKKYVLPLFGAMKGGSKFKLKTGTVGKLPPKRPDLPKKLFLIKDEGPEVEEDEEEDESVNESATISSKGKLGTREPAQAEKVFQQNTGMSDSPGEINCNRNNQNLSLHSGPVDKKENISEIPETVHKSKERPSPLWSAGDRQSGVGSMNSIDEIPEKKKKMYGPSKPPAQLLSSQYPEDDPDYCVWVPPTDQSGDGRTHLNEKYGY